MSVAVEDVKYVSCLSLFSIWLLLFKMVLIVKLLKMINATLFES